MSYKKWSRTKKLGVGTAIVAVLAAAAIVIGPSVYASWVSSRQPAPLALPSTGATGSAADAGAADLTGDWRIGTPSQAGYRVSEVLFGRHVDVAGRTDKVTGGATVRGGRLTKVAATVDMASVATDETMRDAQYRGRIMSTDRYPTSTFTLARPVALPTKGGRFTLPVTGRLQVHGTTRTLRTTLTVQAGSDRIDVLGSVPVTFSDYGIPAPSMTGISVEDHGTIEFRLALARA